MLAFKISILEVIAIVLGAYGGYSLYIAVSGQAYFTMIGGVVALVAAVGSWFGKAWSQYVIYLLSTGFVIQWLWLMWRSAQYRLWPNESAFESVIALIPGLFFVFDRLPEVGKVFVQLAGKSSIAPTHGILLR